MRYIPYLVVGLGLCQGTPAVRAQGQTPHDTIPDFCAAATIQSVSSGRWSSSSTWSPPRVPGNNDIVLISDGTTVTFDTRMSSPLDAVCIEGTLTFDTTISTWLWAATVVVKGICCGGQEGALLIGSTSNPVPPSVTAEIVIANRVPSDAGQYGTGLIGMGRVRIHGAVKDPTFVRLANEPFAGQRTLVLEQAVSGWEPGDRLILPDTRHMTDAEAPRWAPLSPQWEELIIESISSDRKTLTLTDALRFDHRGARDGDGVLDFLPHVGNLTRNVMIRSEASVGRSTTGHVMFTHRADVDVRYALFAGLGRTTNQPLDNTNNHVGRYALHCHHLMGPTSTPANGYQFTLVGNAIDGGSTRHNLKWGMTIHNSHYGLIKDNVAYNYAGALFMFEDGSESYNVVDHNFAVRGQGIGDRMAEGTEGTGFWFRGPNNYVRNNVAANLWAEAPEAAYGFKFFVRYLHDIRVPNFKGADTSVSGQYTVRDGNHMAIPEFRNNEVYCAAQGLTYWWVNSFGPHDNPAAAETVFKDISIWHVYNVAVYHYPAARVTFDRLKIRGRHPTKSACCGTGFLAGDYSVEDLVIRNIDIQGMKTGIWPSTLSSTPQIIENSYFRNKRDIRPDTLYSTTDSSSLPPRRIIVRNCRFDAWPGVSHSAIDMEWRIRDRITNTAQLDEVLVYQFQGDPDDNFRAYYAEQATQNVAGGLAPCTTTRAEVEGIVCPIGADPIGPTPVDTVPPAPAVNLRVSSN